LERAVDLQTAVVPAEEGLGAVFAGHDARAQARAVDVVGAHGDAVAATAAAAVAAAVAGGAAAAATVAGGGAAAAAVAVGGAAATAVAGHGAATTAAAVVVVAAGFGGTAVTADRRNDCHEVQKTHSAQATRAVVTA